MIHIGIDTGTHTGFAVWDSEAKAFVEIRCYSITQALRRVKELVVYYGILNVKVYVEDARQRKWYGNNSNAKLQGAGSVKRDCKIWEDFLKEENIDYRMLNPKNLRTKLNAQSFKNLTGYLGVTNEHSRDAAMMVFNR